VRDFDVGLHPASKQSELARRTVSLPVSAARRLAAAGLVDVDAGDRRRVADAPWSAGVDHTRRTVPAVEVGARPRR